jgi:hypothetical protein
MLASVNMIKVENGYLDAQKGFGQIRALTQHALVLDPNSAQAHYKYCWPMFTSLFLASRTSHPEPEMKE